MAALYALVLIAALLSATTAGDIAVDRGRPQWAWTLAGLFLPVTAPLLVWLMPPNPRRYRRCADCAEWIRPVAVTCRFCGRDQPSSAA